MSTTQEQSRRRYGGSLIGRYGLLVLLILLLGIFSALRPGSFFTANNFKGMFGNESIAAMAAFAVMIPLIVGEFDLSVGAVVGMGNVLMIGFTANDHLPTAGAFFITLVCCALAGLLNGLVVVYTRINAFIATLASQSLIDGLALWYTGGQTIYNGVPRSVTAIGRGTFLGLPLPIWYLVAIALAVWLVLSMLPTGRRMYGVGGNRRSAVVVGIKVNRMVIASFLCSSTLAGFAGIVLAGQLGTATPGSGDLLLLPAFAGVFLGATSVRPGRFNAMGTLLGIYVLAITVSGLEQLGAPTWVQPVFNGFVLIVSVAVSGWALRMRAARMLRARSARVRGEAASTPLPVADPPVSRAPEGAGQR